MGKMGILKYPPGVGGWSSFPVRGPPEFGGNGGIYKKRFLINTFYRNYTSGVFVCLSLVEVYAKNSVKPYFHIVRCLDIFISKNKIMLSS